MDEIEMSKQDCICKKCGNHYYSDYPEITHNLCKDCIDKIIDKIFKDGTMFKVLETLADNFEKAEVSK